MPYGNGFWWKALKKLSLLKNQSIGNRAKEGDDSTRAKYSCVGKSFYKLQEVSPSSFASLHHSKGNLPRNKIRFLKRQVGPQKSVS